MVRINRFVEIHWQLVIQLVAAKRNQRVNIIVLTVFWSVNNLAMMLSFAYKSVILITKFVPIVVLDTI